MEKNPFLQWTGFNVCCVNNANTLGTMHETSGWVWVMKGTMNISYFYNVSPLCFILKLICGACTHPCSNVHCARPNRPVKPNIARISLRIMMPFDNQLWHIITIFHLCYYWHYCLFVPIVSNYTHNAACMLIVSVNASYQHVCFEPYLNCKSKITRHAKTNDTRSHWLLIRFSDLFCAYQLIVYHLCATFIQPDR